MNSIKIFLGVFVLFFVCFVSSESFSQGIESQPREGFQKKNDANPLEKSRYRNISFVFKDRLLEDVKLLTVVVENFGDEVQGARESLEKIKTDYQTAVRYHYRRAYTLSGKMFLEIFEQVNDLFQKFALLYEKQSEELIAVCADELTQIHMQTLSNQNSDPRNFRTRSLEDANFKLKIAHFQMARGDEMIRDRRYADSLIHFRLAKDFSLKVLSDLETNEEKRKEKLSSYSRHLADNRNRIFSKE